MSVRSRVPNGEEPGKQSYWQYLPVPSGARIKLILAGPTIWVEVHPVGFSKPCRSALTNNALPCPHCGVTRCEWRGYTPAWDEMGMPRMVLFSKFAKPIIDGLPPCPSVEVNRGPGKKDPVMCKVTAWGGADVHTLARRHWPADPSTAMLCMWKDPEVTKWVLDNPAPLVTDTAVSLPPDPVPEVIAERARPKPVQTGKKRGPKTAPPQPPLPRPIDDTLDRVFGNLKHKFGLPPASANGSHDPGGGG
jgi:hypothetical protein